MENPFSVSGLTVMPWWALMIAAPTWRGTRRLIASPAMLLAPALLYAALVLPHLHDILPALARPRLEAISALLGTGAGATIAWVHFLAFDLFVGRWTFLDARARGLSAWITSPLLVLTLLLGPLGLLGYLSVRTLRTPRAQRMGRSVVTALRALVQAAGAGSRLLTFTAFGAGALLVMSLLLQVIDSRQVLGVSVWMKPAKFGASVFLTALSLAVVLRQLMLPGASAPARGLRRAALVMSGAFTLELALIVLQAVRGVPSHFNQRTLFDSVVFSVMGAGITLYWAAQAYVTWRAFRQRFGSGPIMWATRLGLLAAALGGAIGFLMPLPTPAQRAALQAGQRPEAVGAHAVGVPDGGPGLPVTGWSTTGGDLRIPHFLGLHGLQVLPLLGLLLVRRRRNQMAEREPVAVAVFAGTAYLGLIVTTLVQALRAQPLFHADTITLAVLAGSVSVAALLARAVARKGQLPDDHSLVVTTALSTVPNQLRV